MGTSDFHKSDLIGNWTGTAPNGVVVNYTFGEDGSVANLVEEEGFRWRFGQAGLRANYSIREGQPLWELDIFDFKDSQLNQIVFRGILQPIDSITFKMQGTPSNHGKRPGAFDGAAIVFRKLDV
jgi:hypothetical protein